MAEFENPTALVDAARAGARSRVSKDGCLFAISDRRAVGSDRPPPRPPAAAGSDRRHCGRRAGFFLQYYAAVIDYPLNIGGRPLLSWPSFIPVTFEMHDSGRGIRRPCWGCSALNGLPDAVPSGIQRGAFRERHAEPVLPVHRSDDPLFDKEATGQIPRRRHAKSCRRSVLVESCASKAFMADCVSASNHFRLVSLTTLPPGHARPAQIPASRAQRILRGRPRLAPLSPVRSRKASSRDDEHLYTGKSGDKPVTTFPFPITEEVLERGQQRFNIYCSPCHDRMGTALGMVVAPRAAPAAVLSHRSPARMRRWATFTT